ncbi:hybrid sensor histidine kinase/response regulator [Deltaproteobacteria bacterium TL4]
METINILIVDDEQDSLYIHRSILEAPRRTIYEASSGQEALELVKNHEFALILMDIQMPEMSGFETVDLLRKNATSQLTPIIFLTAHSRSRQSIFQGYEKGAVDYLFKPVPSYILESKVKVFIDLYQHRKHLEQTYTELQTSKGQLHHSMEFYSFSERICDIAHDLNQPLGNIHLLAEVLCEDWQEEHPHSPHLGKLEKILGQVKRASQLTNHLRTFSRSVLSEKQEAKDINAIIQGTLFLLNEELKTQGIEILLALEEPLSPVFCYAFQIEQVLIHLINNAKEAMETTNRKELRISSYEKERQVIVEIADTGCGISDEVKAQMFESFFTTKEETRMGLGLSISAGILKNHHGTLNIESKEGEGTRCVVQLPLPLQ